MIVKVVRKEEERAFQVTLGHRSVTFDLFNRNMQMSGLYQRGRIIFRLYCNMISLPKEAMGGPIFDLRGDCIGINIARVDRVTTFTLPTKIVFPNGRRFFKMKLYSDHLRGYPNTTRKPVSDPRYDGSNFARLADLHS